VANAVVGAGKFVCLQNANCVKLPTRRDKTRFKGGAEDKSE